MDLTMPIEKDDYFLMDENVSSNTFSAYRKKITFDNLQKLF